MHKLYGDGIHDDTMAIQEMLDTKNSVVELPVPEKHYCISNTLEIYSNQTLKLGETTTIKLMPNSNCFMLKNAEHDAHDIAIVGGSGKQLENILELIDSKLNPKGRIIVTAILVDTKVEAVNKLKDLNG